MDKLISNFVGMCKKHWKAALLVAIGATIIIFSLLSGSMQTGEGAREMTLDEYRAELEEEVAAMCSAVDGVGKCKVFITFERGEQTTYKGSALLEVKPPKVLGVTVVCRGAESSRVRSDLTNMLSALFDIGANRIAILKLNS